ncbi:hypothetical protein PROFUN_05912 [Planoprotostelium fungivorum]|uniref:Transmembrane protein n=1 Tax=Planoprotostelium fungivorum TaxID=1890364 RepID=A0A2P6N7K5_9EUKA|nr:hypothetical protein PROFUN_05912 [Planoprotostelium fungivorum]
MDRNPFRDANDWGEDSDDLLLSDETSRSRRTEIQYEGFKMGRWEIIRTFAFVTGVLCIVGSLAFDWTSEDNKNQLHITQPALSINCCNKSTAPLFMVSVFFAMVLLICDVASNFFVQKRWMAGFRVGVSLLICIFLIGGTISWHAVYKENKWYMGYFSAIASCAWWSFITCGLLVALRRDNRFRIIKV